MRTLCVAEAYPWPPRGGYELRLLHQIQALASLGPVDVLCLGPQRDAADPAPSGVRVLRAAEDREHPASYWFSRWVRSNLPRRLIRRDFTAARALIPNLVDDRYDAVLYCHIDAWLATHDLVSGTGVLDFDNLEHLSIRGRRATGPTLDPNRSMFARALAQVRWKAVMLVDRVDERRWYRVQRDAAGQVAATLVCSELDVARSGTNNAVCVPNGYEGDDDRVDEPRARPVAAPEAPVFLFVGMLAYEPNSDAARWFATEVLPLVRRRLAGARFRIVGRNPEGLAELADLPGVELVGPVDVLADELGRADVAVIPIRFGAGTRLKVVEAMANRLPMVSTTLGCEGIAVSDGVELLIADDAPAFAAACVRAATDSALRDSLVRAAYEGFDTRYRWSIIRRDLAALVERVSSATA